MTTAPTRLDDAITQLAGALAAEQPCALDEVSAAVLTALAHDAAGTTWASVTGPPRPGQPARVLLSTDVVATHTDELQYAAGEGPCLDAAATNRVVTAGDLRDDRRWPAFALRVAECAPVRAVLSHPLPRDAYPDGALNLYSDCPDAFSDEVIPNAAQAARLAALTLAAVAQRRRADNLTIALETSRQIGTAVGILMTRHVLTYEQGFDALRLVSQRMHRKLRDVADEVVLTGVLPMDVTPAPRPGQRAPR